MASAEKVKQLVSMGYTEPKAQQALDFAGDDVGQAIEYLLLNSSDRGGFDGAESFSKPPAVASLLPPISSFPPAATMNNTPASSNLKPPPQNYTSSSDLKPPPSSDTQPKRNREQSTPSESEPKIDLIDDYDEFEGYDRLSGLDFGNIAVTNSGSFQWRFSDITSDTDTHVDGKKVCEIVEMGYSAQEAELALKVTGDDLEQAMGFLLLEKETREAFAGEVMESFQIDGSETDGDAREAAKLLLQQEKERELQKQERENSGKQKRTSRSPTRTRKERSECRNNQTSSQENNYAPKMVVSDTGADDSRSRPFCTCAAAKKFLNGGKVTAAYLESIVDEGCRLSKKANDFPKYSVGMVLMRFGRTAGDLQELGLVSSTVKVGVFQAQNLQAENGFRRLLGDIRNAQGQAWEVVLMELGEVSFCICLPPKATSNSFWLLDLVGRSEFRTVGAYARVHASFHQLEKSVEYFIKINGQKLGITKQDFQLFVVKRVSIRS